MASERDPQWLHGIVDMGSNGIRCSITSLAPPRTRLLPALYTDRAAISLYDAQYPAGSSERQPIPQEVIISVLQHFRRFQNTLTSFRVPKDQVTLLATEATRTALNSASFIGQIEDEFAWQIKLLTKEEEGRVGAMGVISSVDHVHGLIMDLGGGSTQLSWATMEPDIDPSAAEPHIKSLSLPYGAAALNRRLKEAKAKGAGASEEFAAEVRGALADAIAQLRTSKSANEGFERKGGFDVYLSGGGFRGWGYVLMNAHKASPYPIATINGFEVDRASFLDTERVQNLVASAFSSAPSDHSTIEEGGDDAEGEGEGLFRVSYRRASQIPAVSFLVETLASVAPNMRAVRFHQGGVREGYLYQSLDAATQRQAPLLVATSAFSSAPSSQQSPSDVQAIAALLRSALPPGTPLDDATWPFAFASTLYHHAGVPKDVRPSAALRFPTTGELAGAHGISHAQRAALGVFLCQSWGGRADLPPADRGFYDALASLLSDEVRWWLSYAGAVAALVRTVYPAGTIIEDDNGAGFRLESCWAETNKGNGLVLLRVRPAPRHWKQSGHERVFAFQDELVEIEKGGKKKRWVGGRGGFGFKIAVQLMKQ